MFITTEEIDRLIREDVPYMDITSFCLGIRNQPGTIRYIIREEAVVCGTEEVKRIFERLGIQTEAFLPSGTKVRPGGELIRGTGQAENLHMAWKVCQNILEHCSGIATKTERLVRQAKAVNPDIAVLTTRKGFPGTKAFAIKAILAGGAVPHRLGLSETVLVFKQHLEFIGGFDALIERFPALKSECCEKKIIVETDCAKQARKLCEAGADGVQFDKMPTEILKETIGALRRDFPKTTFLAAGGINETNIVEYAKTGADGLVTTSLYVAKPVDIGTEIVQNAE